MRNGNDATIVVAPMIAARTATWRTPPAYRRVAASGSALTYLRALPIEIIILDTGLTNDPEHTDDALLRLVIDTAKGGRRIVMAASVATPEQRDALLALGVDLVQHAAPTTRAGPDGDAVGGLA